MSSLCGVFTGKFVGVAILFSRDIHPDSVHPMVSKSSPVTMGYTLTRYPWVLWIVDWTAVYPSVMPWRWLVLPNIGIRGHPFKLSNMPCEVTWVLGGNLTHMPPPIGMYPYCKPSFCKRVLEHAFARWRSSINSRAVLKSSFVHSKVPSYSIRTRHRVSVSSCNWQTLVSFPLAAASSSVVRGKILLSLRCPDEDTLSNSYHFFRNFP